MLSRPFEPFRDQVVSCIKPIHNMIVAYSLTRYDFGLGFPSTTSRGTGCSLACIKKWRKACNRMDGCSVHHIRQVNLVIWPIRLPGVWWIDTTLPSTKRLIYANDQHRHLRGYDWKSFSLYRFRSRPRHIAFKTGILNSLPKSVRITSGQPRSMTLFIRLSELMPH